MSGVFNTFYNKIAASGEADSGFRGLWAGPMLTDGSKITINTYTWSVISAT